MQPLALTLKGFRGIRDGLGRDVLALDFRSLPADARLVAIAGGNGRGKTTVLDNLHPFLSMPSRAAQAGPGGFSYYDHVLLPENEKDLTFLHAGRRYRAQVIVRLGSRRKTEAYLFAADGQGAWRPVALADGTVSDGKVDTYQRCIEAVCGSAETFFTSVFSAQGKRQWSSFRNAEIKALLADLLGQAEIREIGAQASETLRLLKTGLTALRQEVAALDAEGERIAKARQACRDAAGRVEDSLAARRTAAAALEAARRRHARLQAERELGKGHDARRRELLAEREAALHGDRQARDALTARETDAAQHLARLEARLAARRAEEAGRRRWLEEGRRQAQALLAAAPAVHWAERRLALAERTLAARQRALEAAQAAARRLEEARSAVRLAEEKLASVEREAGQAALKAADLARRFGLAGEVPCAGSPLQGRCQLLGEAREAQPLIPAAQAAIRRLGRAKAAVQRELNAWRQEADVHGTAPRALARAEARAAAAAERLARLERLVARAGEMGRAETALADIEAELARRPSMGEAQRSPGDWEEEAAERAAITAARRAIGSERERQAQRLAAALSRLDAALAGLPAPFDASALDAAGRDLEAAARAVAAAETRHLEAVRAGESERMLQSAAMALAGRRAALMERIARLEDELGNWALFAKCMSNDGLIALIIDDAGPALAGLANDLLLACYGPRFTVSIRTLVATAQGEAREGFDIVVHDAESGEGKSVALMSGGERVWLNECLTRAVAIYLARHTGRAYGALFSDEADGALDPGRKRMFMAMKRAVLDLGGYEREFFISQTPELTAMADAVIDLDHYGARVSSRKDAQRAEESDA